jgi:hypothetical protein
MDFRYEAAESRHGEGVQNERRSDQERRVKGPAGPRGDWRSVTEPGGRCQERQGGRDMLWGRRVGRSRHLGLGAGYVSYETFGRKRSPSVSECGSALSGGRGRPGARLRKGEAGNFVLETGSLGGSRG